MALGMPSLEHAHRRAWRSSLTLGLVVVLGVLGVGCDAGVAPLEPGLGPLGRPGPAVEAATRDPARCRSTDADGWSNSGPFTWLGLGTGLEEGYAELGRISPWAVESWSEISCRRDEDCAINVVSRCPAECTCDSLWGAVNRASVQAIAARQSAELYCTECGYAEQICLDLAKWSARCIEGVCMMCAR
jgi:hypothetical protein